MIIADFEMVFNAAAPFSRNEIALADRASPKEGSGSVTRAFVRTLP